MPVNVGWLPCAEWPGFGFGVAALAWPGLTISTLVLLLGAYALVNGMMRIAFSFGARSERDRSWSFAAEGLLEVAAGIALLAWPGVSALTLIYLIAAWAFVSGVFELIVAVELRDMVGNEWLLGAAGVGSILFNIVAAVAPGAGALALVWPIGTYAIVFGGLLAVLGFRLRERDDRFVRVMA